MTFITLLILPHRDAKGMLLDEKMKAGPCGPNQDMRAPNPGQQRANLGGPDRPRTLILRGFRTSQLYSNLAGSLSSHYSKLGMLAHFGLLCCFFDFLTVQSQTGKIRRRAESQKRLRKRTHRRSKQNHFHPSVRRTTTKIGFAKANCACVRRNKGKITSPASRVPSSLGLSAHVACCRRTCSRRAQARREQPQTEE